MKLSSFLLSVLLCVSFTACNSNPDDAKIQQDINDLFKKDLVGAALNATVNNGVATVTGQCKGKGCTADVAERIKKIKGVKDVQTNIIEN